MRRLNSHLVGIDQGSIMLFSDFEDGGKMWTGEGPRQTRKKIKFSDTYAEIPSVTVTISLWDLDQKSNQRADISAENVTADGFEIVFRTWDDTRVARVRADWMSIGALSDDELWDVT